MQETISDEELIFKTTGTLTRDVYKTYIDILYKKSAMYKLLIFGYADFTIGLIINLICQRWIHAIVWALGIFAFAFVYRRKKENVLNACLLRTKETYGTQELGYISGFAEDKVYAKETSSEVWAAFTYSDIKCAYDTEKYIFIVSNGAQFITIFKEALSAEEQGALLQYIGNKGIKRK